MAGFVRNEMQDSWTDDDMPAPQLYKDIPNWDAILDDVPQEDQISPNDQLQRHNSIFSESQSVRSSQVDAVGATETAEHPYQQRIHQQSYRQQRRPQAPAQSNPFRMPDSSMFMQTPQQSINRTRKKSSKMSPVRQTESQPVLLSPEIMRNVQDIQEFRKIFKQIKKLGLTRGAVASDLTIMYHRESKRREISEFEENDLRFENMWELRGLLERLLQDKDSEKMIIIKKMLQFSKIFRQKRLERGFSQREAASAIDKLDEGWIKPGTICKLEDFRLSLSYMVRLKPLLQRWLKDTDCPSNCSMHFSPPVTSLVTTSTVPLTHPSPKVDCGSSATSIDLQLDSALSDDTQQTTSQVSPNAQLGPHHSTISKSDSVQSPQVAADTVGAAAAAEQRCQQRIQQQSHRQQLRQQAPSQSSPLQMPHSSMFMQTITQTLKKSSKKNPVHQTESQPVVQSSEKMRNVQDIQEFRKIFKQIRWKLGLTRGAVASDLTIMYRRETKRKEISEFEENDLRYENMWELRCLLVRWLQDKDSEKMRIIKKMLQFSKNFRQERLERGFLQTEVAPAIAKLGGCRINRRTISKFEDFSLSLSYMCRLEPLLQRWLKYTSISSNCSMRFSQPVTSAVASSMVLVTHRSPNA